MSDKTKICWFQLKAVGHRVNRACKFPEGRARYSIFKTDVFNPDNYALLYDDVVIKRGTSMQIYRHLSEVEQRAIAMRA